MGNWKYNTYANLYGPFSFQQIQNSFYNFFIYSDSRTILSHSQVVLYFIPRLFILFCVFPTSTLHNFLKRHISSFISAKNNLANFDQKKRKKFKPENGTDGSKSLFLLHLKKMSSWKNCGGDVMVHCHFSKNTMNFAK